mmetsp:Transcript_8614/g.24768  ORF Transcript_8614/g.24768 Transcript_8614/m.24768 type:complete len:2534 (-) Transcript_8614:705-8306(-)
MSSNNSTTNTKADGSAEDTPMPPPPPAPPAAATATAPLKNEMPQSIEEAGAFLGAAINFYGTESSTVIKPPKGMHSSFSVLSPIPSSTLLVRLHSLRALLRNAPTDKPLVAAPSILALLMKLLGASSTLANVATSATTITALTASSITQNVLVGKVVAASPSSGNSVGSASASGSAMGSAGGPIIKRVEPPPMWSTPLRKVWVDCVVLCHALGDGLSGPARINLYGFVQNMIALAGTNPRSARASGGTRIAALDVLAGLLLVPKLSSQLSSWALDIIQLVQRALKSSGNGEPTYRISSVRTACAVAIACRQSSLKLKPLDGTSRLVMRSAMEDKAIVEVVKLLKQGTMDKFPEVRRATATLAGLLAPMLILSAASSGSSGGGIGMGMGNRPGMDGRGEASPTTSLEDVMTISFKNLDDESPDVSAGWADAFARCMCTAIEYCKQVNVESGGRRGVDADGSGPSSSSGAGGADGGSNASMSSRITSARKGTVLVSVCSTLPNAVKYLVGLFVKVGGELMAPRAGGPFSAGGRPVRLGVCRTLVQLLRLQSQMGAIGESRDMSTKEALMIVLTMVGNDMDAQLHAPERNSGQPHKSLDATSVIPHEVSRDGNAPSNPLFGQSAKKSHADPSIARICTNRVIRKGITELATESAQISILHDMIALCKNNHTKLRGNQLQVLLIEVSHLLTTLGEAAASVVDEAMEGLKACVIHPDHGVRHEAAVTYAALTALYPAEGHKLVQHSLNDIQMEHAELMALASTKKVEEEPESVTPRLLRFGRRNPAKKERKVDDSLKHQYAIHGLALMISMIIRDLPNLPGGLPLDLFGDVLSVSEILVSSLFNEIMTKGNASAACTSVRAGFAIISGCITAGPTAVAPHFSLFLELWQKTSKPAKLDDVFTASHELICVDAMLASVATFLKYCSELLLSVPDALSKISMLLEELLSAFYPDGRLGKMPSNPIAASRFHSAKACLLESFAWLPPGSFPMVAESVFSVASYHIQLASESDVACSILRSLINKEDHILDAQSLPAATRVGQVGGAQDLEEDIFTLTADIAHHGDRESVMHLVADAIQADDGDDDDDDDAEDIEFRESSILSLYAYDGHETKPPTPLHRVGTWQLPSTPCASSKIRLIDAAVQAFSATFSLKSGKEQQAAVEMLESLVPAVLTQTARGMVVPGDQDKRSKQLQESSAIVNIVTVLLACLKTIPLHEATHNVPIGLGPLWMNKAKDLLVMLLPSSSHEVRRAAAEGLALLATLGVTEDAHFLQSSVLHSLDELMQGNKSEGKGRGSTSSEHVSAGRSGALLTLACIQRTASIIQEKRSRRAKSRQNRDDATTTKTTEAKQSDEQVPTTQMITRLLPSIACQGVRDFFGVRTYALHAFGVLLSYSNRLAKPILDPVDNHLLRKSIELVEDNFAAAWTAAAIDYDKGNESEKLSSESSFLAALLRLMTMLVPLLHHVQATDPTASTRFSCMATIILECQNNHPAVVVEAMAFYEVLAKHPNLLPPPSPHVKYHENALLGCIPFITSVLTPARSNIHAILPHGSFEACVMSLRCVRATLRTIYCLSLNGAPLDQWSDMDVVAAMFAKLEDMSGSRLCAVDSAHRSLAEPRSIEVCHKHHTIVERELCETISAVLHRWTASLDSAKISSTNAMLLRWVLLAKNLLSASTADSSEVDGAPYTVEQVIRKALSQASDDCTIIYDAVSSVRWQVKSIAIRMMKSAILQLDAIARDTATSLPISLVYDPKVARKQCQKECQLTQANGKGMPSSYLALHFSEILNAACSNCIATVDQSELQILQENAMHLLVAIIRGFGPIPDPHQPENKLLEDSIPQVSSCIKNALGAWKEHQTQMSNRLFMIGCESLRVFVEVRLSTEKATLKRIARAVFLEYGEAPTFTPTAASIPEMPKELEGSKLDSQGKLMMKLGKLYTAGIMNIHARQVMSEFQANDAELGIHSAALALDGVSLLLSSKLSLCGGKSAETITIKSKAGFFFEDYAQLDDYTKSQLASMWARNGSNAIMFFAQAFSKKAEKNVEDCKGWLRKLVPVIFAGFHTAMTAGAVADALPQRQQRSEWAQSVIPVRVAVDCLQGIAYLVSNDEMMSIGEDWSKDVDRVLRTLMASVIEPILAKTRKPSKDLVDSSCKLFRLLARTTPTAEKRESSPLLTCILMPLHRLQQGALKIDSLMICNIVASSMESIVSLLKTPDRQPDGLANALLPIIVEVLSKKYCSPELDSQTYTTIVENPAFDALKVCLVAAGAVSVSQQRSIATDMMKSEVWMAWKFICGTVADKDAAAIIPSLAILKDYLLCLSNYDRQLSALRTLREAVTEQQQQQPRAERSKMMKHLTVTLTAEVFMVFRSYATLHDGTPPDVMPIDVTKKRRTEVCSDCMKIILSTLQQFSTPPTPTTTDDATSAQDDDDDDDETKTNDEQQQLVVYLSVLFETFVVIMRFNGLPNHPTPQPGKSDPSIGRMCAQALLHIARTSPTGFKSCMAVLSEQNRAVLEFAVRGEMSGYSTGTSSAAAAAPVKKKLSLKGFK